MQDTRTNRLETAETLEELRVRIPHRDRGPVFRLDELVRIKGYWYRVVDLAPDRLAFAPHGKAKNGSDVSDYRPRRRGQKHGR